MRKLITLVLMAVMALTWSTGCDMDGFGGRVQIDPEKIAQEVVEGNRDFAFNIFRELNREDGDDNIFISPISISTALTMTYQGARGSTKEAMTGALGYSGLALDRINDTYGNLLPYLVQVDQAVELDLANSIWIKEGTEIEQDFLDINQQVFLSELAWLDFSQPKAVDEINQWVDQATKGKIDKILEDKIPHNVLMYLINAIYFKGEWTEEFDEKNTLEKEFWTKEGKKQPVMMMSRMGEVNYGEGQDYKVVRLPYGQEKMAMYVILPHEEVEMADFVNDLDKSKWEEIKANISKRRDVRLELPRFKIEYGIKSLNNSLSNLGMGEAFDQDANFSGIRDEVWISRVLHKGIIEVNEQGSEAAAVTAVVIRETAAMEPITFIADRPFLFLIAEEDTGTILFMGKLEKP